MSSTSFSSSSSAPPRRGRELQSCALWCSSAVGLVVVVVEMAVVGSIGCLSLLLTKTGFHGVPLEPSCAVARQVASFVRSLLSLRLLAGGKYALMSSSHLVAGLVLLCMRYPFCLVDIAGFQLEMKFAWASFVALGNHSRLLPM